MLVTTEGLQILADGLWRISTKGDNPVRDGWYALYLPSGVRIEFGVDAESRIAIEAYEPVTFPALHDILGTSLSIPVSSG